MGIVYTYICTKAYKGELCEIQQHRLRTQKNLKYKKQKGRKEEGKKQEKRKIMEDRKTAGLKGESLQLQERLKISG